MKNMRKKSVAVLIGLAVTGLVGASAATLGAVEADTLGAGAGDVSSCDGDGVTVEFTTAFDNGYAEVDDVVVGSVDALCDGLEYTITLLDDSSPIKLELGSASDTVSLAAGAFTASVGDQNIDAEAVYGIAITISG